MPSAYNAYNKAQISHGDKGARGEEEEGGQRRREGRRGMTGRRGEGRRRGVGIEALASKVKPLVSSFSHKGASHLLPMRISRHTILPLLSQARGDRRLGVDVNKDAYRTPDEQVEAVPRVAHAEHHLVRFEVGQLRINPISLTACTLAPPPRFPPFPSCSPVLASSPLPPNHRNCRSQGSNGESLPCRRVMP